MVTTRRINAQGIIIDNSHELHVKDDEFTSSP